MSRLYFLVLLQFTVCIRGETPIVEIPNGKIRGEIMFTPNNRSFYAFRGIPYAKPPIGNLRFEPPQKPENWTGILDSDAKDRICIQMNLQSQQNEREDCLYLHVYTPQMPSERMTYLPVMYVIHGGGFAYGTATIEEMGPQYLMDYDVVVVTVAYRLGFFGFLSTGDLNLPGNYGLKDQLFGMRWVRENIRHFGGDPRKVTIFGESAGGVSVGLHSLAENCEGLFVGAIQDSGSSLANWALQTNPKGTAYEIAKHINSTIDESNTTTLELLKIFKNMDIQQIKRASVEIFGEGFSANYDDLYRGHVLTGTIEPAHKGAFLTASPYQKLLEGNFNKVPTLLGINSEESLFMALKSDETLAHFDQNTELYVPPDMYITDLNVKKLVGKKITKIYSPSSPLHENKALAIRFFSDTSFGRPALKQAQLQFNYTDVYFYEFGYSGKLGKRILLPDVPGAGKVVHSEEMMYMFHRNDSKDIFSVPEMDRLTMKRMLTMWTNFVKYQNPTPIRLEILQNAIWPKIESIDEMPYLLINNSLDIKYNLKKEMMKGYEKLYSTYSIPPLNTY